MKDRLTILITNIWLENRAGSECVVRDLAIGLLRRGHRPIVYSPSPGEIADEIAHRGIAVIDDLRKLGEQPDILHGHHSVTCGEVLIRFPRLPAIAVCHAFSYWVEAPAHFPQIGVYVAVDEASRDRLVHTEAIDAARVVVVPNAVELRRVPARPQPLPRQPLRALAFGKASAVEATRTACDAMGIAYEAAGLPVGRILAFPEQELVKADLVFASARAALEALCCGCAVVVCDQRGMAGMVTSRNYETMRAHNFGLRSLTEPVTVETCIAEASRYDAHDAALVSERARRDADLEKSLDRFEQLYTEVLGGVRPPSFAPEAHAEAVARFLHDCLPRRIHDSRWPWVGETIEGLRGDLDAAQRARNEFAQSADVLRERLSAEVASADALRERLSAEVASADALRERLSAEVASADALRERLSAEIASADVFRERVSAEVASADTLRERLSAEIASADALRERASADRGIHNQLQTQLDRALAAQAGSAALLADLKRSRLLRLGRLLRRLAGRPTAY
jgi:hypothetical protein